MPDGPAGDILGGEALPAAEQPAAGAASSEKTKKKKDRAEAKAGSKKRKQPEAEAAEEGAGAAGGAEAAAAAGAGGEEEGQGRGEESLEALRAKVARLESENQALRGGKREAARLARKERQRAKKEARAAAAAAAKEDAAAAKAAAAAEGAAEAAGQQGGPSTKQGKKAGRQKQNGAAGAAGEAAGEPAPPLADVSAWRPFELHPLVEAAVARLGFSEPTRVQSECIPAAVRDRRDVIGAAQTVGGCWGLAQRLGAGRRLRGLRAGRRAEQCPAAPSWPQLGAGRWIRLAGRAAACYIGGRARPGVD